MQKLDLCGKWEVHKKGDAETISATVPGCIHTDLLAAGKVDDPYYRDNEGRQMWIGETDWVYTRTFGVDQEFLKHERVLLKCEGLDTLATIAINRTQIGKTNNQFRIWEFDIKPSLRAGENTIEICFDSTIPFITAEQRKRFLDLTGLGPNPVEGQHRINGSNRIRKSQCNYGWDWGPMCATAGIWRPIKVIAFDTARITAVQITQDHSCKGAVGLSVALDIEKTDAASLMAKVSVSYAGKLVCQSNVGVKDTSITTDMIVPDPHLWWPNGLGEQPLYEVKVELMKAQTVIDTIAKRIGLRTLAIDRHPDQWGESFQFVVNGKPFFAKGANWIPADTFVTRITKAQYEDLIKSSADAHFNMLRVWGGGIYEDDVFYDLCDQYGICVWQEFMFACSAYPAFDAAFLENVKYEANDNVKRLRHHPSLALWCGNNELEQGGFIGDAEPYMMSWTEYRKLFDELLPGVVYEHDPGRCYWPSSPHSPFGDRRNFNNPTCGDAHLWDVWHGRKPFEWYRTCEHRFNSEFGFQSFPEPDVVYGYTEPADRNITSYIMEWHQRSQIGNGTIIQYMLSWFRLPTSFDMLLWSSQILHGMAMKYAVEHWRRSMPRGMGTLYWQINDCWPVASWSSIDYYGNWKALHYMARDFFAPLLVSGLEDPRTGTVEVHVTSDLFQAASGIVRWTLTATDGNMLASDAIPCEIEPCANQKVKTLQLADYLAQYGGRRLLLWLELLVDDRVVSRNLVYFMRPKHLELQEPGLAARVCETDDQAFEATIDAKHPALWVWPDLPGIKATYTDRFSHIMPGKPITVTIKPEKSMTLTAFEKQLQVKSLVDTWK